MPGSTFITYLGTGTRGIDHVRDCIVSLFLNYARYLKRSHCILDTSHIKLEDCQSKRFGSSGASGALQATLPDLG